MQDFSRKAILIFSTAYLPLVGGAELAVKNITDRISDCDFLLITTRLSKKHPKRERIGNVDVFRVGYGVFPFFDKLCSPLSGAFLARRLMREHDVKLFWSVMVTFTSGAPFLLKLFRISRNVPILLTLQEGDSPRHLIFGRFGLNGLAWLLAMRSADYIQAISGYLKDFARKMGARCPIEVVPNGADFSNFQFPRLRRSFGGQAISNFQTPEPEQGSVRGAANTKSRNSNSKKIIITTSRLVHKNGIDTLIGAMHKVKKEFPAVKCWVMGAGEKEFELKDLAKKLELDLNILSSKGCRTSPSQQSILIFTIL